jgi:hypothetical protein
VVHRPSTHRTLIAAPEATVIPLSVKTRSQQQPHAGGPPQLVSKDVNAFRSVTFNPTASM